MQIIPDHVKCYWRSFWVDQNQAVLGCGPDCVPTDVLATLVAISYRPHH